MKNSNLLTNFVGEKTLAIAVSGGVDSLTLATYAHRFFPGMVKIFHSATASVPPQATNRLRVLAAKEGWSLQVIDANEFNDKNYISNPVNRCFFCKTNLYATIRKFTEDQILSGANKDDLKEFRPGLSAARKYGVRHPFVEVGLGKSEIRALAKNLGLADISELPSSPCLSSRVETGIHIQRNVLTLINETEMLINKNLRPETVRCRIRSGGVYIELDNISMSKLTSDLRRKLSLETERIFSSAGFDYKVNFDHYRLGSAFLN